MSQMIDGARDEFDALDPLESDRGASSRRSRRAVIVDESYGDDAFSSVEPDFTADDDAFFEEEERPARSRRGGDPKLKKPKKTKPLAAAPEKAAAPEREKGGGGVWGWAVIAAMIWIGAVIGFSAGLMRMQLTPVGEFIAAMSALDPRSQMIIFAVAIAPLGLIVQTALAARRSQRLAAETRRLSRLVSEMGGGSARAAGGAGARHDAEETTRAFGALEEGFEAAEERMQLARNRFETERAAFSKLVDDIDHDIARMTQTLGSLTGAASDATRAHASELAEMIASAMARSGGSIGSARGGLDPMGDSPRERVQRMAEAAGAAAPAERAFGRSLSDSDFDEVGGDAATEEISALQRRLQGGLDDIAAGAGEDDDRLDDGYGDEDGYGDLDGDVGETGYDDGGYDEPGLQDPDFQDPSYQEPGFDEPSFEEPGYETPAAATAASAGDSEDGLDWSKLVRAANFPDSEDDRETLDALYAVLTDHEAAALLQSAEDALSSLADFGLFMEDMQPRHAPVELWRAFVLDNARGEETMDLGGVRDPHAIEDVAAALHDKPEFEETAKRFLERYENVLARLFREAPSPRMAVELADTRSGRAYMLIGRAYGRFG